jgi:hypothetical protein
MLNIGPEEITRVNNVNATSHLRASKAQRPNTVDGVKTFVRGLRNRVAYLLHGRRDELAGRQREGLKASRVPPNKSTDRVPQPCKYVRRRDLTRGILDSDAASLKSETCP